MEQQMREEQGRGTYLGPGRKQTIGEEADESWYSFLQPADWEILIMDAILDIHTEDGKHRTMRVSIPDNTPAPPPADCTACKSHAAPPPPQPPAEK
ncbi:unnamed protein product [Miscanthus lutarioriparius]|uniref:Uncharacterized protein n=1 Tax=Miscanthus lutarioriparius TaxID=422564 RepID=A0A811QYA5_9POAL|nr:unnamed protein product [Miscanthus lutarioriparius]